MQNVEWIYLFYTVYKYHICLNLCTKETFATNVDKLKSAMLVFPIYHSFYNTSILHKLISKFVQLNLSKN